MTALVESGQIADLILIVVALEGLGLLVLWILRARGVPPGGLVANLMAGAALLLALRASLSGAGALWIAGWLALAGLAHLVDLRLRWR
jgi:hypothetical protein